MSPAAGRPQAPAPHGRATGRARAGRPGPGHDAGREGERLPAVRCVACWAGFGPERDQLAMVLALGVRQRRLYVVGAVAARPRDQRDLRRRRRQAAAAGGHQEQAVAGLRAQGQTQQAEMLSG